MDDNLLEDAGLIFHTNISPLAVPLNILLEF